MPGAPVPGSTIAQAQISARLPGVDAPLVVVGGGPVGSTLGLLVPGALVLEAGRFPRDKPCGEGLLPAGVEVLRRAGIELQGPGYQPAHKDWPDDRHQSHAG